MAPINIIGLLASKVLFAQALVPANIIRIVPSTEIKAHHPGNRYVSLRSVKFKKSKKNPRMEDVFFSMPMCCFKLGIKWAKVEVLWGR